MREQNTFEAGNAVIDLNEVSLFQDAAQAESMSNEKRSLIVQMKDDTETLVQGHDQSEAFVQAIDDHLGI